ncbi:MAG: orotidine 5'-phosphate decarboxylase [Desulfuromonadales bacterium C00003068]|jgi:orotidine-5'-phosphate decarboxylase|nr:MAG: orotidine 5'-phosphate decarboxylase [Desulfuromonadales bacterium C00003068]
MKERLIFALDVDSFEQAQSWVRLLHDEVGMFKVGKQLFTRCGPSVVQMIRDEGGEVFLDLKYHDIPNTVAKASIEAARMGVKMFNVHALGGRTMMKCMVDEVVHASQLEGFDLPIMLGVTILTSSSESDLHEVGILKPVVEMVPLLAALAQKSGLNGVVASAQELALIRAACGNDFVVVTPGVRPATASQDDQQRVMTPVEAIRAGSNYLVVGRPISKAADPAAAAREIVAQMSQGVM